MRDGKSMLVHGSDNALIAAYHRIKRVRQVRPSLPSPFKLSRRLPTSDNTRVTRPGRIVVTLIRYTQISDDGCTPLSLE